jgi:hypothetical protein
MNAARVRAPRPAQDRIGSARRQHFQHLAWIFDAADHAEVQPVIKSDAAAQLSFGSRIRPNRMILPALG